MSLKAAIVGTKWGLVHAHALRSQGVEVVALGGRDAGETRSAAQREGVALAVTDLAQLNALDLDLLVIATPAHTHADVARAVRARAVLCEKPLQGALTEPEPLTAFGDNCWVNYAFAQLPDAWAFAVELRAASAVHIVTESDLGRSFDAWEALGDLASHPLAYAVHALGSPRCVAQAVNDTTAHVSLMCGRTRVEVEVRAKPGLNGLRHRVAATTPVGTSRVLEGIYTVGQPWAFARHAGALPDGALTPKTHEPDPWMKANHANVGVLLALLRGQINARQARERGLMDAATAAQIDAALRAAYRASR